jgi:Beta protein
MKLARTGCFLTFVFPPLRARDLEKKRTLSQDEFSAVQVGRLQRYWRDRPCLADLRFLKFPDNDRERSDELLSLSRRFGCKLIPVVDFRVDEPRMEVIAAHIRDSNCGGAIRIELSDLDDALKERLDTLTTSLRLVASEVIVVVDLAEATIPDDVRAFSRFTAECVLTHMRYATAGSWFVPRGGEPTKDHDGTIHTVASRIIDSGEFMGVNFSNGDEFIALCADHGATGNGSTWRRVNMVHHMTLATGDVANLIGRPFERSKRTPVARQLSLLPTDK